MQRLWYSVALVLVGGASAALAENSPVPVYYVYVVSEGPEWVEGVRPGEQQGFEKHFGHLLALQERGALVMAGPFKDDQGGGMSLLRADDLAHAKQLIADDPWVASGKLRVAALRPWAVGLADVGLLFRGHVGHQTATRGPAPRVLSKEVTVPASLEEVWRCWTTSEGIASFFSPESNIELRVGGAYELYMSMAQPDASGKRGSEGCVVLSYVPREMLSFEWNFPPKVPALRVSGAKTHVVLRFTEVGDGQVKIKFDQLGWGEGEDWDQGYEYFDAAWDWVLGQLKRTFESKASAAAAAP